MDGFKHFENRIRIILGGPIAQRLSLEGSLPGWKTFRDRRDLIAHEEAGHAYIGFRVGVPPVFAEMNDVAGRVCFNEAARVAGKLGEGATDEEQAKEATEILTTCAAPPCLDALQAETETMLHEGWTTINEIACALNRKGSLNATELEALCSQT